MKVVEIKLLGDERQKRMREILTKSLDFSTEAADEVLEQSKGDQDGCLTWLLYGVREYAKRGSLRKETENFSLGSHLAERSVRFQLPPLCAKMIEQNLCRTPPNTGRFCVMR